MGLLSCLVCQVEVLARVVEPRHCFTHGLNAQPRNLMLCVAAHYRKRQLAMCKLCFENPRLQLLIYLD